MYLIEFEKGQFTNAEAINWINLKGELVSFTVSSDEQSIFIVTAECEPIFLNHLQSFNNNIHNICTARAEILAENK